VSRKAPTVRVAAIYDVHGNLPALEAVLDEVREEGVDLVVVGGDVVPGPMARESLAALLDLSLPVRFVRGNGENDLLALHRGEEPTRVPAQFREVMHRVGKELLAGQWSAIASWPATLEVTIPGLGEVLFCHATPRDDNEIFTRLTPEDRLLPVFGSTEADLVLCGHTHMQFDRTVGQVRVVNAGSVGLPFGDPGAYWALLGPSVELRRSPYDLEAAAEGISATGYPQVLGLDPRRPLPEAQMLEVLEAAAVGRPR
jgi:putative phosphoesterase